MNYESLRKKHPRFIYESFAYSLTKSGFAISFAFRLEPNIVFRPKIVIAGVRRNELKKIPREALDNFIFHLGLAEMLSYWKCAVSPVIEIRAGRLDARQVKFFQKLLFNGLGEFFHANGISPAKNFVRIASRGPTFGKCPQKRALRNRVLFPNGGGKDSLAAMQILKIARVPFRPMTLGNVSAATRLAKALRAAPPATIERRVAPKLLTLNQKGYLNGHTPFSAYLAFASAFAAELFEYGMVAVANERSANEPTFILPNGAEVNHQYSKSYEFERDFRAYAKKYLTKNISYFSMLRPLYEIQIARLAALWPKALRATVSCNRGQRRGAWCGKCAKCLTVFILFFPFIKTRELVKIFGKDLLNDASLWHFIPALAGEGVKPFDCVATKKEMQAALILSLKKAKRERIIPTLIRRFEKELLPKMRLSQTSIGQMLAAWDAHNFVPRDIAKAIKNMIKKSQT